MYRQFKVWSIWKYPPKIEKNTPLEVLGSRAKPSALAFVRNYEAPDRTFREPCFTWMEWRREAAARQKTLLASPPSHPLSGPSSPALGTSWHWRRRSVEEDRRDRFSPAASAGAAGSWAARPRQVVDRPSSSSPPGLASGCPGGCTTGNSGKGFFYKKSISKLRVKAFRPFFSHLAGLKGRRRHCDAVDGRLSRERLLLLLFLCLQDAPS